MDRVMLTNGRWFDKEKATKFPEDTWWDGNNNVSKATGDKWYHEDLYRTASGNWVLCSWSNWQNINTEYEIIPYSQAQEWLLSQGYFDEVDEEVAASLEV